MTWLEALFWACGLRLVSLCHLSSGTGAAGARRVAVEARLVEAGARGGGLPTVSVVLAAFNEEASIGRRISEFTHRLEVARDAGRGDRRVRRLD